MEEHGILETPDLSLNSVHCHPHITWSEFLCFLVSYGTAHVTPMLGHSLSLLGGVVFIALFPPPTILHTAARKRLWNKSDHHLLTYKPLPGPHHLCWSQPVPLIQSHIPLLPSQPSSISFPFCSCAHPRAFNFAVLTA